MADPIKGRVEKACNGGELMSIRKPYHQLLLAGVSLLISASISTKETIDFHVHDTYIVVTRSSFYWVLAMLTYLLWAIYFLTRKVLLSNTLIWLHVVPTVIAIALFICVPFLSYPDRYVDLSPFSAFNRAYRATQLLVGAALVFMLAQVFLVVNIAGGVFNWLRRRRPL
ncbi:MAG: hypothetical protein ACXVBZ_08060 [Flavisolibacter sp.]